MKKIILAVAAVAAIAIPAGTAQAGGWGHSSYSYSTGGNYGVSSGLVNVSPSLGLGDVNLLNGLSVLNGSPIASGNVVSGILSGNRTSAGNGILGGGVFNGGTLGILGGNRQSISRSSRHHRY